MLRPGTAEPGLWGHLAAGTHLDSAVIHVRTGLGQEYATYTLTNVTVASFDSSFGTAGTAAPCRRTQSRCTSTG